MAIDIKSLKKAKLTVCHKAANGDDIIATVDIPAKLARALHDAGAKRTMRKSERGGEYDTIVVRLHTDTALANGKNGG